MIDARTALLAQRAQLLHRLAEIDVELGGIRQARSDSTSDDEHDPEGSTISDDWSRISGMRPAVIAAVSETDAALARLDDGTYGTCLTCGRAIAPGRLEARLAAALCIDCASAR